jgi:hypothetical protein
MELAIVSVVTIWGKILRQRRILQYRLQLSFHYCHLLSIFVTTINSDSNIRSDTTAFHTRGCFSVHCTLKTRVHQKKLEMVPWSIRS